MSLLDRLLGRITIDTFARDLIKAAARAGQRGWRYVPELKELRAPNDRGRVLLHNLFLEYSSAAPDSRQALMNKYVGLMVSSEQGPPRSWTEACNAIYPMIRGRWDMMPLEIAHRGKDGARLPPRIELPWCESLILRIAYDSPSAALPIGHDEIQSWGVSVEQALEQAMDNLRALPAPRWRELVPSVFYLESPMHYEEAMLLRDDVVSSCPVKGMPVFIASNRGIVLATGTDEPNGVATMLTQAAYSYQNRPWPMSPVVVMRNGDKFESYTPTGIYGSRLRSLKALDTTRISRAQQQALQDYCQRNGINVYVGVVELVQDKKDPDLMHTWTGWLEGVPTWLPQAEFLVFNKRLGQDEYETISVPWDEAVAICAIT
jgi:hypothetical protein